MARESCPRRWTHDKIEYDKGDLDVAGTATVTQQASATSRSMDILLRGVALATLAALVACRGNKKTLEELTHDFGASLRGPGVAVGAQGLHMADGGLGQRRATSTRWLLRGKPAMSPQGPAQQATASFPVTERPAAAPSPMR